MIFMPRKRPPTPPEKMRKTKGGTRRGPLSEEEKAKVKYYLADKSSKDIALLLKRPIGQIDKYLEEILPEGFESKNVAIDINERQAILRELHGDPSWTSLQKQFFPDEILFFENDFCNYYSQFKELTTSETKQVYQLITLDIKMQRHNVEQMKYKQDINKIERRIENEYKKCKNSLPVGEELESLQFLENQLAGMRAASGNQTKEYNDLLGKHQAILKDLKGLRDQRLKSIEDRGKFMSILKDLELADTRNNMGELIGLHDLAVEAEEERLRKPYLYADSTIDNPLLEPDGKYIDE
jgi:hypothetical protein